MAKTNPAGPIRVIEETPAYWRVVFDYPPFNILDATIFEGLQDLLVRMDANQSLRVVVFESANPDFYLAHFDLTGKTGNITTAVGPSGLPILMDTLPRRLRVGRVACFRATRNACHKLGRTRYCRRVRSLGSLRY